MTYDEMKFWSLKLAVKTLKDKARLEGADPAKTEDILKRAGMFYEYLKGPK